MLDGTIHKADLTSHTGACSSLSLNGSSLLPTAVCERQVGCLIVRELPSCEVHCTACQKSLILDA